MSPKFNVKFATDVTPGPDFFNRQSTPDGPDVLDARGDALFSNPNRERRQIIFRRRPRGIRAGDVSTPAPNITYVADRMTGEGLIPLQEERGRSQEINQRVPAQSWTPRERLGDDINESSRRCIVCKREIPKAYAIPVITETLTTTPRPTEWRCPQSTEESERGFNEWGIECRPRRVDLKSTRKAD